MSQCLIPIYVALHLMGLNRDDRMLCTLKGSLDECILDNMLAWIRYNRLRDQAHQARTQLHELTENFTTLSLKHLRRISCDL